MTEDDLDRGAEPDSPPPPRALPRNVPTLTEVVGPDATQPSMSASGQDFGSTGAPVDAQALLALLGPELDRRISEAIGRVLHEQMLGFNGRVQKAVADVVREAVAKSLVQGDSGARHLGENP